MAVLEAYLLINLTCRKRKSIFTIRVIQFMSNFKYAEKILCIGGSTLNSGTLENLRNSLIQTNFLEDWAIIFANHCYFNLQSAERYIEKINSDFEGLELVFV
ncbi:hypothetical protein [Egbenema bharatensis]|uniref:hypothetical protein n=1 Tax=Egbenema bharatensis TaxID=3463334 RepID=UPI003A86D41D